MIIDCGSSICMFAPVKTGQRTQGGCRCLERAGFDQVPRIAVVKMLHEILRLRAEVADPDPALGCPHCDASGTGPLCMSHALGRWEPMTSERVVEMARGQIVRANNCSTWDDASYASGRGTGELIGLNLALLLAREHCDPTNDKDPQMTCGCVAAIESEVARSEDCEKKP